MVEQMITLGTCVALLLRASQRDLVRRAGRRRASPA
jgi:hypothetical protein